MLVKICGVTTLEDAQLALQYGADAIGFVFHPPSPRYIETSEATRIIRALSRPCLKVGVFVGFPPQAPPQEIDILQLHGLDRESTPVDFGRRVWMVVEPENADWFPDQEVVVDSSWGRGVKTDWTALRSLRRPFILSGGLTPGNVQEAIETLHPVGVDVSSGVESSPGRKAPEKVRAFLQAAREAERRTGSKESIL